MVARGTGVSRFAVQNSSDPRASATSVQSLSLSKLAALEVWDIQSSQWEGLSGSMRLDPSPAGGWNFKASIAPSRLNHFVRSPDNKMRVRVRLENVGVQVSSLSVES